MTSVGSQMRRENEKLLQDHIDEFMEDSKDLIEESDIIFFHAPGENKIAFLA